MDNTVSWCITDIFEYVIKYHNDYNTITYSKDSVLSLKSTGESTQETNSVACDNVIT